MYNYNSKNKELKMALNKLFPRIVIHGKRLKAYNSLNEQVICLWSDENPFKLLIELYRAELRYLIEEQAITQEIRL